MKKQELIDLVANNPRDNLWDMEDQIHHLYKMWVERVAIWLDLDEHRHYEKETIVYKCEDWFVGIHGVSKLYSEESSYEDIGENCTAFEMKEVPTVTYQRLV